MYMWEWKAERWLIISRILPVISSLISMPSVLTLHSGKDEVQDINLFEQKFSISFRVPAFRNILKVLKRTKISSNYSSKQIALTMLKRSGGICAFIRSSIQWNSGFAMFR